MTIRAMHYDFKQKLNRVDSQKYRGLRVPEIDWKLNEAQEIFVKIIAEPRLQSELGFEANERVINDIRTIVINQNKTDNNCITPTIFDTDSYLVPLPPDFWFYVSSKIYATREKCTTIIEEVREIQHDDESQMSPFDRSSFDWRVVNIRFIDKGIRAFTGGEFNIDSVCLNYIKQPRRVHNAQDWTGGSYIDLDGNILTGSQDCELPPGTHKEVVDLAVLLTAGDLNLPSFNFKYSKLKLTN